ncbi:flavin reductase family protein [Bordetella pseudohinzii]|uniref:Monooxygenase n=1 Tax=Bordetella pseudohinzii TaxID=1331258 RepID=A0A0J6C9M8_9BORD|nr:flavin reductase family protein [Bordetella pseudohinzii]ANY15067.1 monooxygenase [Bordetella pseudohinzii]KMM26107.1 monooxygenase [Bordetella pseudohinzii]KXA75654.1 monooxygenase [Bordetella pseudohinzii]KXA82837.1 monooxygenase [Bordetella pseudohinzii]CUI53149.1 Flavin-dependent monooxygenase%2C reductase subunit HsaB [Bordetella pseudohinzii]
MEKDLSQINGESLRALLGSYPTGVAVVTGRDAAGAPLGMVVGTFTSVSLEPPLVAFLPMKTSRTFKALREGSDRFCINILAADQEPICRALAAPGEDKFAGIGWQASPLGNPVIDGVVAWIDCSYANVVDAGDHDIVLGAVRSMGLERDALPLLFFQRGYGRFASGSLLRADERAAFQYVRMAEAARPEIEAIAGELRLGCSVVASTGADSLYVATADHPGAAGAPQRLGVRAPLMPPLGALFVDSPAGVPADEWLGRLGKGGAQALPRAREQLARVRERGWSIALLGDLPTQELDAAIDVYSCAHRTPEQERRFLSTLSAMFDMHEPERIEDDGSYDVLHLSVPVRRANGDTVLVLRLSDFPRRVPGRDIARIVARLQTAARNAEPLISRIAA